jgi:molecular chaperone GrpE
MKEESVENQIPASETVPTDVAPADADQTQATPDAAPPAAEPSAQDQIEAAKKLAAENYERFMRVSADLENFRRRTVREKEELRQYASSRVLEDLLPVLDNLGLGLAAAKAPNANLDTLVGGITMVADQLKSSLANHGLVEINPVDAAFDPNLHEALSQVPHPELPEGHVAQIIRVGYSLNGRLLRPASVIVSSGPAAS